MSKCSSWVAVRLDTVRFKCRYTSDIGITHSNNGLSDGEGPNGSLTVSVSMNARLVARRGPGLVIQR